MVHTVLSAWQLYSNGCPCYQCVITYKIAYMSVHVNCYFASGIDDADVEQNVRKMTCSTTDDSEYKQ